VVLALLHPVEEEGTVVVVVVVVVVVAAQPVAVQLTPGLQPGQSISLKQRQLKAQLAVDPLFRHPYLQ